MGSISLNNENYLYKCIICLNIIRLGFCPLKPRVPASFQIVEKKLMASCAITTETSKNSFHVMATSFAQAQQGKKRLLKVPMHVYCCAQVSCNYDEK